jgi:hypothetical protein
MVKNNGNPITYRGKVYPSVRAFTEAIGLDYGTTYRRLASGLSPEQIVSLVGRRAVANRIVYNGKEFYGIMEFANHYGYDYGRLQKCFHKYGLNNPDKVLQAYDKLEDLDSSITLWGKTYDSLVGLAEHFGINLYSLKHHYSPGEDIAPLVKKLLASGVDFKGQKYSSLTELSNSHGIDPSVVHNRLLKGKTMAEALNTEVRMNSTKPRVKFRGVWYMSYRELYTQYGFATLYIQRSARSWGIEQLQVLDIFADFYDQYLFGRPDLISSKYAVIYNGVWFKTFQELLKVCGLSTGFTDQRSDRGGTYLEAMAGFKSATKPAYVFQGNLFSYGDLKKYAKSLGNHIESLIEKGHAKKTTIPLYPQCTYNPKGYCKDIGAEYDIFVSQRLAKLSVNYPPI